MPVRRKASLRSVHDRLHRYYGPRDWWPAETPFEVCVGAILTQNTAWTNVEKAIASLKKAGALTAASLQELPLHELAVLVRPAGYYNSKSRTLKEFVGWLSARYNGSLEQMCAGDWQTVRRELLTVRGIGPETCDSILLYAGEKPTFVVDAYTRRLFSRLGLLRAGAGYDETRDLFMTALPADHRLFNRYHALIVEQCKQFCRTVPRCSGCPLHTCCPAAQPPGEKIA